MLTLASAPCTHCSYSDKVLKVSSIGVLKQRNKETKKQTRWKLIRPVCTGQISDSNPYSGVELRPWTFQWDLTLYLLIWTVSHINRNFHQCNSWIKLQLNSSNRKVHNLRPPYGLGYCVTDPNWSPEISVGPSLRGRPLKMWGARGKIENGFFFSVGKPLSRSYVIKTQHNITPC